ncbi:lipoyl domain-containing protein [Kineosporia rhizophila]|uniref:lipoyl domain-containing protein n=1 Tax=Kineosporia rhizophila TaxID=84633 RepID=UPI001E36B76B|nr:lipoyl domain-containing protein [Kineosporia rhizophila]MCE0535474.1 lipoyl domain-containing protein [Kineosporia rhizophila]
MALFGFFRRRSADPAPATRRPEVPPAAAEQPLTGGGEGTTVRMPTLGESITECTVARWLRQPGDSVRAGEPLLEVSTDKVDTEIPSPVTGVIREILVRENETVKVGAALAVVRSR